MRLPFRAMGLLLPLLAAACCAETNHWSLQPLQPVRVPGGIHPVDALIQARLATNGLTLSPAADRTNLLRRLTFDLTGLPPTPQEIDSFISDKSRGAYGRVVERLLASPRYGERWGRHWLDVARYTESQGFEYDRLRTNAWHYRDYVIRSFNEDKPYDRFMREQIAGDVLAPVSTNGLIAAGLLVCGPWDQAGNSQANATQKAITREDELEDILGVVGQSFLGLTINCARCHAHKFDPIPQEEYYRIKSVFEGVKHGERPLDPAGGGRTREEQIAALKKEIGEAQKEGNETPPSPEALARIDRAREALAALKTMPVSYIGVRVQPKPTHRLKRGDVKSPLEEVRPGALSAVTALNPDFGLAADAPEGERRLKFAEWLADPRNPLPARVMANRVWHYHFGQGLVTTPSDLGANGTRPSHPELLDWLARELIKSGWSIKALHRLIVTSATYQQSSAFNARAAALDSENHLLWRFSPHRLEAEALRDAMLAASGEINLAMGGPSFRPFKVSSFNSDFYETQDPIGAEFNRRTVYRMNVNSGKDPLLDVFDCPDPSVKTPRRSATTTPLQALALMNDSFVQRQANKLAERAEAETKHRPEKAIQLAYRLTLGRTATRPELKRALAAARERGLSSVCWALLNSTEFVYVQ